MASINGIQLKAVKRFRDHDGFPIPFGNVYVNGRKRGSFAYDPYGGPVSFDFDTTELAKRAEAYWEGFPEDYADRDFKKDLEIMVEDLLNLMEDEKRYKKALRSCFNGLVVVEDGWHLCAMSANASDAAEMETRYAKLIAQMKGDMSEGLKTRVRIYTSMEDFEVTVDEDHPAPSYILNI